MRIWWIRVGVVLFLGAPMAHASDVDPWGQQTSKWRRGDLQWWQDPVTDPDSRQQPDIKKPRRMVLGGYGKKITRRYDLQPGHPNGAALAMLRPQEGNACEVRMTVKRKWIITPPDSNERIQLEIVDPIAATPRDFMMAVDGRRKNRRLFGHHHGMALLPMDRRSRLDVKIPSCPDSLLRASALEGIEPSVQSLWRFKLRRWRESTF